MKSINFGSRGGYVGNDYGLTDEECKLFIDKGWENNVFDAFRYRRTIRTSYNE